MHKKTFLLSVLLLALSSIQSYCDDSNPTEENIAPDNVLTTQEESVLDDCNGPD